MFDSEQGITLRGVTHAEDGRELEIVLHRCIINVEKEHDTGATRVHVDVLSKDGILYSIIDRTVVPSMTRSALLSEATKIIHGDRQEAYGDAQESFQRIADVWNALLKREDFEIELLPHHVAIMMIAMKLSRTMTSPEKADNWVDIIGYGALGGEVFRP